MYFSTAVHKAVENYSNVVLDENGAVPRISPVSCGPDDRRHRERSSPPVHGRRRAVDNCAVNAPETPPTYG